MKHGSWVLRGHDISTSQRGTLLNLRGKDDPAGGQQMAATDPPRHTKMREPLQRALAIKSAAYRLRPRRGRPGPGHRPHAGASGAGDRHRPGRPGGGHHRRGAALAAVELHAKRQGTSAASGPIRVGFFGTGLIARYIHTYLAGNGLTADEVGVHDSAPEHASTAMAYSVSHFTGERPEVRLHVADHNDTRRGRIGAAVSLRQRL